MKIIHTGDWHIGSFKGPEKDGVNLRSIDTQKCLEELVRIAEVERPELALVSGDIFDRAEIWQSRSHREVLQARNIIMGLARSCGKVIVMRGTPNHDGKEVFEELAAHFEMVPNVEIVITPRIIQIEQFDIAALPGFDRGTFRANHPGLGKEEEHEVLTKELANAVLGLKAQCTPGKKSILMSHYTIPGCNAESGQIMMLTQFEPVLLPEALVSADFDLVAMGHIHRPQKLPNVENCFYCGAINAMTFNDEGQERGFWIHDYSDEGWERKFYQTPYRQFISFHFNDTDISAINEGRIDEIALNNWRLSGCIRDKIVRILYSCSLENSKALNVALLEKLLYEDGAFYVAGIMAEKVEETADRNDLSNATNPEENLKQYLREKQYPDNQIYELVLKARPIIAQAEARASLASATGKFEPIEIEVRNYRNYEEEKFNFENISFCTINGQNGAGKSSLFMDAIIDCLYEEPREGELTGWIRNDEKARSGSIIFTFRIGEKIFRVTRTRSRSGKGTLNLSEYVDGNWHDRSLEKYKDTQNEIVNILGMDSMTFKSCALIMQDQYGLFLQAPKEDRMVVLGNLLGLGTYEAMYKIVADKARECGAKTRDLKQEMEIHNVTIKGYGNPEEDVVKKKYELDKKSEQAKDIAKNRDIKNLELLSLNEAQERCNKLSEGISSLTIKKAAMETNRGAQADIISSCKDVLEAENDVIEKANAYRQLETKKQSLIESVALYQSKLVEAERVRTRIVSLGSEAEMLQTRLKTEVIRLESMKNTDGDEIVLKRADEYQDAKKKLDEMQMLALRYQEAEQKVQVARANQLSVERSIESLESSIMSTRSFLGKDIALLSSDCRCIDIEKANCKFLEKARAAKSELEKEEAKYKESREEAELRLSATKDEVRRLEEERESIAFSKERKNEAERRCAELFPNVAKAEYIKKKAGEIEILKVTIENIKSNLGDIQNKLDDARKEEAVINSEINLYKAAFEDNEKISLEMQNLASFIETEKQIPLVRERYANALQRFTEYDVQISEIERDIADKQAELSREILKTTGITEKQAEVNHLNMLIEICEKEARELQMQIGALMQKLSQIAELKKEIAVLQDKECEAAKETADYDILKAAFSQDGIPHQIIRTIVPRLTATANTILGQMTGGKMGILFKTEKVLKSNSKKEVVTLDIFIEEFGKASLPYLSKSGGEKVKASLSVILALAEIKSSSAGIQLGMLFIDEPPFLDSEGIQAYCDALETIQRRYTGIKIMAITHDPTMKARFPQNLDVIKTDKGSKVFY